MVRSLRYAAAEALLRLPTIGVVAPDAIAAWQQAADFWYAWSSSAFLRAYSTATAATDLLPRSEPQLDLLLKVHLMERAIEELQYELDNRPERATFALHGILELSQ